jgi:uncharacterized membrane protein YccC
MPSSVLIFLPPAAGARQSLMVAVVALGLGLGLCCCGFAVSTGGLLYLQARARKRWARVLTTCVCRVVCVVSCDSRP